MLSWCLEDALAHVVFFLFSHYCFLSRPPHCPPSSTKRLTSQTTPNRAHIGGVELDPLLRCISTWMDRGWRGKPRRRRRRRTQGEEEETRGDRCTSTCAFVSTFCCRWCVVGVSKKRIPAGGSIDDARVKRTRGGGACFLCCAWGKKNVVCT